ncbi:MAG: ParB/RepB/Spo0J family partition protein, partial [Candidatus Anammoxibacter sp.]
MSVQTIPLKKIRQTQHLLRPVRKNEVDYLELKDSMAASGQLNSILVRPMEDGVEVVDGMYRWSIANELGWDTLECTVKDIADDQLILMQLQCNGIRPETRPVEFAKALKSILVANEGM